MDLKALRADSAFVVADRIRGFNANQPRAELLETLDDLSIRFTIIAIANLLLDGESQKFFMNLRRAAENSWRIHALLHKRSEALPSASKNLGLLGALTTGDFAIASKLAALSRTTVNSDDDEYDDEFHWAAALGGLTLVDETAVRAELSALQEEAAYAGRVATLHAILDRDAAGFQVAFVAAHHAHKLAIEARAQKFGTPVVEFAPYRFVWLEGLAMLRLAERAGLPRLTDHFRYCPPLARLPFQGGYQGDWAVSAGLP